MNERQQAITELLDEHEVSTQLQLQRLLARRGHDVTQATVSRDLDRLGVVRDHPGHEVDVGVAIGILSEPGRGRVQAFRRRRAAARGREDGREQACGRGSP